MRVGILDLLTTPSRSWSEAAYNLVMTKQYASITPQAISVWCRQAGHETFYATYSGFGDPRRRLPDDLDVVFISTYSQASALAYALAKLYGRDGTLTVVGGPHAKAFPLDCARFFDVVVLECDRALVAEIVAGRIGPGSIASSERPYAEVPSVEERLGEIRTASFARGRRPFFATTVPLLASTGCPYACDFCIDGRTPYRPLDVAALARDLDWVSEHLPGTMVGFHDPNFAVRFDDVLDVMGRRPASARSPYIMETSLAVLRPERVARLGATRCAVVAPGIESWGDYSGKVGLGRPTGAAKVARLVEHFALLHEHVPYLQANFMFGLDGDRGDEPIALTKEFMTRTPFVWPVVNIPHPFGGTPMHERYLREGRILAAMPFSFYYSPWVVTTLRHYDPVEYYDRLIDVFAHFTSPEMLLRRLRTTSRAFVRTAHVVRTRVKRRRLRAFRRLRDLLRTDRELRRFHEGRSATLPELYHREYDRMLGPYASLMSRADRTPELTGLRSPGGGHADTVPRGARVEELGVPV